MNKRPPYTRTHSKSLVNIKSSHNALRGLYSNLPNNPNNPTNPNNPINPNLPNPNIIDLNTKSINRIPRNKFYSFSLTTRKTPLSSKSSVSSKNPVFSKNSRSSKTSLSPKIFVSSKNPTAFKKALPKSIQSSSPPTNFLLKQIDYTLYRAIKSLPALSIVQLLNKSFNLPPSPRPFKRTLVLDLDETLVHCCAPNNTSHTLLSVNSALLALKIRPFAREFLNEAKSVFEIVIFTASNRAYADAVIEVLDPSSCLVDFKLYRENCIEVSGFYIKDLRLFKNRSLKDIVIVDNSIPSFAYQLNNGIPIASWYGDNTDKELKNLLHFLKDLSHQEDVRALINKSYRLDSFFI